MIDIEKRRARVRVNNRKYCLLHPERRKESYLKYYYKNRERECQKNRERYRRNRWIVLSHYGLECFCCHEDNVEFLTIDHIEGGGNEHRRLLKSKGGQSFYAWLIQNNFPSEFRTLCMNCNFSLGNYGYCPHKK